jgi:hypothetical protein
VRMRHSLLRVAVPLVLLILAGSFGCGEPPPLDRSLLTGEAWETRVELWQIR